MQENRRRHRRLPVKMAVTCRKAGAASGKKYVGNTHNVCPGGMLIEVSQAQLCAGQLLTVEVSVPPAEGLLEFGGSFSSYARVLRTHSPAREINDLNVSQLLAVEFCQPPKLNM